MGSGLPAARLLSLWEVTITATGAARQALTLLSDARPQLGADALTALPLGEVHQHLLRLQQELFGEELDAVASCPLCGTELELLLPVHQLLRPAAEPPPPATVEVEFGGLHLRARTVTMADLLALEDLPEPDAASRLLVDRCLLEARRQATKVEASDLQTPELEALADALAAADPHAELILDLTCAACDHHFQQVLQPAAFLVSELRIHARRLLQQVHRLARGYGWREADILALSPQRRHAYLELLES